MTVMPKLLTILTPTYNRAAHLGRLYDSLKAQGCRDFDWLVIDDGSSDGTEALIRSFMAENALDIRYRHKENGGKHTALNIGIALTETPLLFIVDSDDYLPPDAVEIIQSYHGKYKNTPNLCGYSFLRCYEDGTVNTAYFKNDEEIASYRDIRINGGIGGDKAEVFYTDILKKYPFPEYEGETFVPEDLVWMQMSGPYRMVHINRCVYIGEYLDGGLTQRGRSMKIHSPRGMMARSAVYLRDRGVALKVRVKMMLLYIVYGRFAGCSLRRLLHDVPDKPLFFLCAVPAVCIYAMWKRTLKK